MKTHVLSVSLATALAGSLMLAQPAAALTFVDPVNLVQNTLTAIRTLEQINNQINQLQNEAQMLMNQARNLANLDFNIVNRLRSTLATTERLIAEAQGLTYDVQNMDREFARLYPEQYAATVSGDQMLRDARERWKNTLDGLHTAMRMQAQVSQNLAQDESALADLVSQSQSATGALQAMQATNQLLAPRLSGRFRPSSSRSRKTGRPRWNWPGRQQPPSAPAKCGGSTGTPYTPQSVNFYNN